jgi:hypothetical protein
MFFAIFPIMGLPQPSSLTAIPSAFAAACRMSRTEGELFERCRGVLTRRFETEEIWFEISHPGGRLERIGPSVGAEDAVEVARLASGSTEVAIRTAREGAEELRGVAMPLALGLSVVLELRAILVDRQNALDDAAFQLQALRQVARLLSSVHSAE